MSAAPLKELLAAAQRARTAYDWEEAVAFYSRALSLPDLEAEDLYALHDSRATCHRYLGQYRQEDEDTATMARLGEATGNAVWYLEGATREAIALQYTGEIDQSRTVAAEALAAAERVQLPYYQARALYAMGQTDIAVGEYESGTQRLSKALKLFEELGALRDEAQCARQIAFAATYTGHDGRAYADRVLQIARQMDDPLLETSAYHILGIVHADDPTVALTYREKALELAQIIRAKAFISSSIGNIAVLYLDHGLCKRAHAMFRRGLDLRMEEQTRSGHVLGLHLFAITAFALGKVEEALSLNERAIVEAQATGRKDVEAFARQARGTFLHQLGQGAAAREYIETAVEMMVTAPTYMPSALAELASVCLTTGDIAEALRRSDEAQQWLQELPDPAYPEIAYWLRYVVLDAAAEGGAADGEEGWRWLEQAFTVVRAHAAKLLDSGMRRAYLTSTYHHTRQIMLTWAEQAYARGEEVDIREHLPAPDGSLEPRFRRLLAFGTRLAAQHDAEQMPSFILEEFVELTGAERAFLALRPEGVEDLPAIVAAEGMSADEQDAIYDAARATIERALLARHAVLVQDAGEAAENGPAAVHQRSLLVVPLVATARVMGVLYGDIRAIFGPFTREDADLLTMLANHAAVALENAAWTQTLEQRVEERTAALASAIRQLEQRNSELAIINTVQQGLAEKLEMQSLIELVGNKLVELLPSFGIGIALYDGEADLMVPTFTDYAGRRYEIAPYQPTGVSALILETGEKHIVNRDYIGVAEQYGAKLLIDIEPPKAHAYLPILTKGEVTGILAVVSPEREDVFDEATVRLLESLTASLSISLEHARLFGETERRAREMATLAEIGNDIAASRELEPVLERIAAHAKDILHIRDIVIVLRDPDGESFRPVAALGRYTEEFRALTITTEMGVFGHILGSGEAEFVNDPAGDPRIAHIPGTPLEEEEREYLMGAPLISRGETIGGIMVWREHPDPRFNQADLDFLVSVARQTAIAIESARLYLQTQRRASEMAALVQVGREISASLDLGTVLERITTQAVELLRAESSAVFLPDGTRPGIYTPIAAVGDIAPQLKVTEIVFGQGIIGDVARKATAEVINNTGNDPRAVTIAGTETEEHEHLMAAPLLSSEGVRGLMAVWRTGLERQFTRDDLDFLSGLSQQAVIAIENARLYSEAEAARAAAEAANESKSAFLANVSHELRTPLTSILGFARIVEKRLEERIFPYVPADDTRAQRAVAQVTDNLKIVLGEGERLTTLINNVLDLEKIEAGRMEWRLEPVSLLDIVDQALQATSALVAQAGLRLRREAPGSLPPVAGDRHRLVQVMLNLISNAVKFTAHGSITCRVEVAGGEARVSVIDTGVGIAPKDMGTVFEKFRQVGDTLTDKPAGTGLGLPICREIVEHHGGRIWVESTVGEGSTFAFALPLLSAPEQDGVQRLSLDSLLEKLRQRLADVAATDAGARKKVLVADDDPAIRELLRQELTAEGYEVHVAADGREALTCVRSIQPDLVVLDVMMPELSGFDLAAVIRNSPETMGLPIVIVSVLEDKERGFRVGVDRYLTKPINTAALLEEVQSLLAQGASHRKVLVIDEDANAVQILAEVLQAHGYEVMGVTNGPAGIDAAIAAHPDMIIVDALLSEQLDIVKAIRFEKGLENVLFLLVQ
jgi:signal transduction histidine kinase/CheY-like chemotaxis protein/tetratricopeptide (TPR) repeat protein